MVEHETRATILAATKASLLESGYASLSTRSIAETAGVPLSQIHYHFGSKRNLVLALLDDENQRLLERQAGMFSEDVPVWKQWEQACDYLEDDLRSGYVRVLQEMTAAGWSDAEVAAAVREDLSGWYDLLAEVARTAGPLGPFTVEEIAALVGAAFLGAEAMILLGFAEGDLPVRSALRKVGALLRMVDNAR